MDRKEFDRRYGTDRKYATVIFVPHAKAVFRKLKISHRLIAVFLTLVGFAVIACTYFTFMYFTNVRDELAARHASTRELESELTKANAALVRSYGNVERLTRHLISEQRERERQLSELQQRYDTLSALATGQEKIAEAHRAILTQQSLLDRAIGIGLGFLGGVISSLAASFIWKVWTAPAISDADAKALKLNE